MCDYCGAAWPRRQLRKDGMGLLACPQEGDGPDLRTRQRQTRALQRAQHDHVTSFDGAAYHFPPTVYSDPVVENLLLQQVSTEDMLFAFCPGERVSGAYFGPLLDARPGAAPDEPSTAIGYLSNNRVDHGALAELAPGGDAYTSKIYDQLGSGYSLVQSRPTRQPRVFLSGALVASGNDQPCAQFDGASHSMLAGIPATLLLDTALTIVVVYQRIGGAPGQDSVLFELGKEPSQQAAPYTGSRYAAYWSSYDSASSMRVDINAADIIELLASADADLGDFSVRLGRGAALSSSAVSRAGQALSAGATTNPAYTLALEPSGNLFSIASNSTGGQLASIKFAAAFAWARSIDDADLDVVNSWVMARV
jgi:hypothetical protein